MLASANRILQNIIPAYGKLSVEDKVNQQENDINYFNMKNYVTSGIDLEKNNDNYTKELCEKIAFAKAIISHIEQNRMIRPVNESQENYNAYKLLLKGCNQKCGFSGNKNGFNGGKFYKLKVKRNFKTQKQFRNSKKYKGKSKKLFRKSKS